MILIVTNTQDLTADFVVRELRRRGSGFARLNTDEFPRFAQGVARFGGGQRHARLRWTNRERALDWDSVSAVWYRRPIAPVVEAEVSHAGARKFAADESYEFLRGLWYSMECFWMSHPDAIRRAEHKIVQLTVAQQVGLDVPSTVVTNNPDEVLALRNSCERGIVAKPLYLGFIEEGDHGKFVYTTLLTEEHVTDREAIQLAPAIYQEYVPKVADVRVTVVGSQVFATRITAEGLPPEIPDWRFAPPQKLLHARHDLPPAEAHMCVQLVRDLHLEFGAIDFALRADGRHVFLEVNPNGQWAWLEQETGDRISAAIADRLEACG
jgi:glutathione synthase/RimK-type ligase-like ATP-grasp enzyme